MESFQETVETFKPMIHHIIRSLHIYKNFDEYYQTSLIALWEAKEKFNQEKGKFSNYAYAYIKGRLLSELSKSSKNEEHQIYPKEEFWEATMDDSTDPTLELETLLSYCSNLTAKQKQWVIYTFYLGMDVKDIATKEAVSVSAVKKWRVGALQKLRETQGRFSRFRNTPFGK